MYDMVCVFSVWPSVGEYVMLPVGSNRGGRISSKLREQ